MRGSAVIVSVGLAVLAAGCQEQPLVAAPEILRPTEKSLTFPSAYLGSSSSALLRLENDASGPHRATLIFPSDDAGPAVFAAAASLTIDVAGGERADLPLTFTPVSIGTATGTVIVATDDAAPVTIALTGIGLAPLPCSTPPECELLTFDPQTGTCVSSVIADGTACTDSCLLDSHCLSGQCVGQLVDCDGGNLCTEDVCEPGAGCLYLTTLSVCPTPTTPCLVPTCDPTTGCATVPAVDGTGCGPTDCVTAHICLNGVCEEEAVPEGAACGVATPCQSLGACHDGGCEQVEPGPTNEAWEQDLDPTHTLHWMALSDANDDLYWAEVYPDLEGNTQFDLVSVGRDGFPRFQTSLGTYGRGDHPFDVDLKIVGLLHDSLVVVFGQPNTLAAYDQTDGSLVWSIDFSDLVNESYHPEYFTGQDDLHVAQMVDDGDELVVSIIGVSHSQATDYSWGTWIRGLSWADGSTQWQWAQDGRSRRLIGDGLGNLYEVLWHLVTNPNGPTFFANGVTNFSAIVDGQVYALSPSGEPLWQHVQTRLLDVAADGNRLFVDSMVLDAGCLISQSLDYAAAGELADDMQSYVPWAFFVYDWPMMSQGITYRLSSTVPTACGVPDDGGWLGAFDNVADESAWNFGQDLAATNVSATTLSSDGSILFAFSFNQSDGGPASILSAVDPDGGDAFQCPVVPFSVLTEPVLQSGRWVVGGSQNNAGIVISYSMPPNFTPATQGWTASRGNMSRTNRPQTASGP